MGFFTGLLGKKLANAKDGMKKMENKDLMEATVAACILLAYADGDCEEVELKTMESIIASTDSLKHFGAQINETVNKYHSVMQAGPRLGKVKLMREIADVKGSAQEKEEVFVTAITIAESDGEIEPQELTILKEIGNTLGLSLKDYGIAA